MERNERFQLELFNQPKDTARINNPDNFSLLGYIRNYEKIILFIICFIVIGIIAFSLGVEKGKKHLEPAINQKYDLAVKPEKIITTPLTPEITPQNTQENAATKENADPKKELANNYTIQIASFKNKTSAKKEVQSLEKSGWTTLILNRSGYNVVCIGNFETKEKAGKLLTKIRKKYKDGFIRRL